MQRSILTCAFLVLSTAAFGQQQQQASPSDPYQGQSNPPADDVIVATPDQPEATPKPKPPAGKPLVTNQTQNQGPPQPAAQPQAGVSTGVPSAASAQPSSPDSSANVSDGDVNGTDDGIVHVARPQSEPVLNTRAAADPDGDIVHLHPLNQNELPNGTMIRVRLLNRLSSAESRQGETFRTRVASDVLRGDEVLIPAGAEIDGRVVQVASGTASSHGTMLLRPTALILPDGSRFTLDAQVSGTPGANTHVSAEGVINPGSRLKKDGLQAGGATGAGVVVGALIAGPVGAVAGGLIGAGAMTAHIITNHSEAVLEEGTVLLLTLDNSLDLQAAAPPSEPTGN